MYYRGKVPFNAELRFDYRAHKAEFIYPQTNLFIDGQPDEKKVRLAWFVAPHFLMLRYLILLPIFVIWYIYHSLSFKQFVIDWTIGFQYSPDQILAFGFIILILWTIIWQVIEIALIYIFGTISLFLHTKYQWFRDNYAYLAGRTNRLTSITLPRKIKLKDSFSKTHVISGNKIYIRDFNPIECNIEMSDELWTHLEYINTYCYKHRNHIGAAKFWMELIFDTSINQTAIMNPAWEITIK